MENKVILITGGSRGLGKNFVERLTADKENIVCFTYFASEDKALKLSESEKASAINVTKKVKKR